jgi:hypothetical protein
VSSRVSFQAFATNLAVRIAAPKQMAAVLFLPLWWVGWTVGVVAAWAGLVAEGQWFLLLWLAFAMPAWVGVAAIWLWWLFGYEEIQVDGETLEVGRSLGPFHQQKAISAGGVRNLRASGFFGNPWIKGNYWSVNGYWWGFGGGTIAFDFEGKTQRFGIQLEEAEAQDVIDGLKPFLPAGAAEAGG